MHPRGFHPKRITLYFFSLIELSLLLGKKVNLCEFNTLSMITVIMCIFVYIVLFYHSILFSFITVTFRTVRILLEIVFTMTRRENIMKCI